MKVLITGGSGFLGHRVAQSLLNKGRLTTVNGQEESVDELIIADAVKSPTPLSGARYVVGDISEPGFFDQAIDDGVKSVFHLAAVVSSAAEADFDLGMRVNVDATRALLERCRRLPEPPKVVFTSSVAVFGLAPRIVTETTPLLPQSSYGAQKVIGEILVNDCSRKGFIDGRCVRLPTIVVRPGRPNKAASSFASSILREPLSGEETVCPVEPDLALWILSPRQAVSSLVHAHELPGTAWGAQRSLNLPGITVTVNEMVEALKSAGGDSSLIRWERDADIERIVATWPAGMETPRANEMGFRTDESIHAIINAFLEDELGRKPVRAS